MGEATRWVGLDVHARETAGAMLDLGSGSWCSARSAAARSA